MATCLFFRPDIYSVQWLRLWDSAAQELLRTSRRLFASCGCQVINGVHVMAHNRGKYGRSEISAMDGWAALITNKQTLFWLSHCFVYFHWMYKLKGVDQQFHHDLQYNTGGYWRCLFTATAAKTTSSMDELVQDIFISIYYCILFYKV